MKVVRRLLIILSVLLIGFFTLVFSKLVWLDVGVVGIVIAIILKQIGLLGRDNDYGYYDDDDTDWDDDGDD